jgi:hypothetical protein
LHNVSLVTATSLSNRCFHKASNVRFATQRKFKIAYSATLTARRLACIAVTTFI